MKKKNSNLKAAGILLVLILMLMMGLIYINNMNSISSFGTSSVKSLGLAGQINAANKNSSVCSVDGLLAEAAGAVVQVRDIKEDMLWSKSFPGKITSLKSVASYLYILDSGNRIYCMSKSGKLLWDKLLEGEIKDIYLDKGGDVLIDYTYNGESKIAILNDKGVDEGSLGYKDAEILAFASGVNENTIAVVDLSAQILKTKVITLNLKGDMIWSDNFDNQIIPMLTYDKNNNLIAIGEKSIYRYKGTSKKQTKLDLNRTIYRASIGEAGAAVVVRSKKNFELMSYDMNFKELGKSELESVPKGIISGKDNYILYYDEKLLVSDAKCSIKAEYKSIPTINKAYFTEDGSIITVSDRLIQKISSK